MTGNPGPGANVAASCVTARAITTALRAALDDARNAVTALADRVRAAHEARVWLTLGYRSWEQYAVAELGISRAQAYRLIVMSRATNAITAAVTAALPTSPAGYTDLGLSGRALRDIGGQAGDVAAVVAARLSTAAATGPVTAAQVRAIVADVVDQARRPVLPARPPVDTPAGQLPALGDELARLNHRIGELALQLSPAYRSDAQATGDLAHWCDDIGIALTDALACRRYALTGDRRALANLL